MAGQLLERGGDQCDGQHQLVHDAAELHRQHGAQVAGSQAQVNKNYSVLCNGMDDACTGLETLKNVLIC